MIYLDCIAYYYTRKDYNYISKYAILLPHIKFTINTFKAKQKQCNDNSQLAQYNLVNF